jgi:hypothetical protein
MWRDRAEMEHASLRESRWRARVEIRRDRAEMEHASLRESSALLGEGNQGQLRAIRGDRTCPSRVHFWAQVELNVACSARVLRPTQGEGKDGVKDACSARVLRPTQGEGKDGVKDACSARVLRPTQGEGIDTVSSQGEGIGTAFSDRFSIHD